LTAIKEEELLENYILVTLEDTLEKMRIYVSSPGKILSGTCGRMRMYDKANPIIISTKNPRHGGVRRVKFSDLILMNS